jgi:hypothetical protein
LKLEDEILPEFLQELHDHTVFVDATDTTESEDSERANTTKEGDDGYEEVEEDEVQVSCNLK